MSRGPCRLTRNRAFWGATISRWIKAGALGQGTPTPRASAKSFVSNAVPAMRAACITGPAAGACEPWRLILYVMPAACAVPERFRPALAAVINMIRQTGLALGAAIIAATTLLGESQ